MGTLYQVFIFALFVGIFGISIHITSSTHFQVEYKTNYDSIYTRCVFSTICLKSTHF